MQNHVYYGDNIDVLRSLPSQSADLIYIDPPFNTGKVQSRTQIRTQRSENGDRKGFGNRLYETHKLSQRSYRDQFEDLGVFLYPRLLDAYRILKDNGSLYFHIDFREVHYCKVMLDKIFGRNCFINEIIWAYDFGGRAKDRWPAKHDNILFYAKDADNFVFNREDIDRIPYMAPGLVGKEKAEKGKLPTDTWWHTIVGTNSKEKTGYPTQKPLGVLQRIVAASSPKGGMVLDFFAGSGTTGQACLELGRQFILVDNNLQALEVMQKRFEDIGNITWHLNEFQKDELN